MIVLPTYLQMVLEYNAMQAGLSLAPLSLTMFGVAVVAGRRAGDRRPASLVRAGFALLVAGTVVLMPIVPRETPRLSIAFITMTEASTVIPPSSRCRSRPPSRTARRS